MRALQVGAFLNDFWSYAFFRTLCGVGEMGMVMVSFTLSVELVGAREQAFVGNMNQLSFAVGQIVVSGGKSKSCSNTFSK